MKVFSKHNGHDPNVTFLDGDKILHLEEERISRIKHQDNDTSKELINHYLNNFIPDVTVEIIHDAEDERKVYTELTDIPKENHVNVSHHLAHAAYAYYTRPKHIDKCDIIAYDGWGWETDLYFFDESLNLKDKSIFGIGMIWAILSEIFYDTPNQEGKIMGMSAYGTLNKTIYQLFNECTEELKLIHNYKERDRKYKKRNNVRTISDKLLTQLNQHKPQDIARTIQQFTEDKIKEYILTVKSSNTLLVSGGIGQNGYVNQLLSTIYKEIHIPPAISDAGLSIGGALFITKQRILNPQYLGRIHNPNLKRQNLNDFITYDYHPIKIAAKIALGKTIGFYQGHSESGPRALGNRSILADPRNPLMKDHINNNIKRREWYRPYAPVVMQEHAQYWFDKCTNSPYMNRIAKYKRQKSSEVPAVCHVDNTGRVQTVTKDQNSKLYDLIDAFYNRTGVPLLLNTSFNIQEPIVDSPDDAMKAFVESGLDILVIDNIVLEKKHDRFTLPNSKFNG